MGLWEAIGSWFGKQDSKSSVSQPVGEYTVSRVMSDLGIGSAELNRYMQMNGITPVNGRLTQSQVDRIYDTHLRYSSGEHEGKKTYSSKKPAPPKITTPKVAVQAITNIPDTPIKRSHVPGEGGKVYNAQGREYTLTRFIASGGEGSIYALEVPGRVAKIYNDSHCTTRVREKIKLMTEGRLRFKGICFPLEVLNNSGGEFCGFIMSEAKGKNLSSLFIPQREFESTFPNWKKIDLVMLSISILNRIKYLHEHNVIMGDISPFNIMFVSPEEVYFIDTDSYQYGPFPCRVGTNNFVAPELLGKNLSNIMRTQGNENFAVATLLFMLMMQGKQPYSHQGGSQSAADVKAGIFPYGAGERPVPGNVWELQPVGLWRYIWSHLTLKLKYAFIDTFRQDGHNNTESTRFPINEWLTLMHAYRTAYKSMTEHDSMSGEIFPTREKYGQIEYRTCSTCGERKPASMFYDQTTCRACYFEQRKKLKDARKR